MDLFSTACGFYTFTHSLPIGREEQLFSRYCHAIWAASVQTDSSRAVVLWSIQMLLCSNVTPSEVRRLMSWHGLVTTIHCCTAAYVYVCILCVCKKGCRGRGVLECRSEVAVVEENLFGSDKPRLGSNQAFIPRGLASERFLDLHGSWFLKASTPKFVLLKTIIAVHKSRQSLESGIICHPTGNGIVCPTDIRGTWSKTMFGPDLQPRRHSVDLPAWMTCRPDSAVPTSCQHCAR